MTLLQKGQRTMKERKTNNRWFEIAELQTEANSPKERLMRIADELREIGAIRKANSLETIIEKLEIWQNT